VFLFSSQDVFFDGKRSVGAQGDLAPIGQGENDKAFVVGGHCIPNKQGISTVNGPGRATRLFGNRQPLHELHLPGLLLRRGERRRHEQSGDGVVGLLNRVV